MKPLIHVIASLSAGAAFYIFTKSIPAALLCFLSGIFIDLDHIIEYVAVFGWRNFTVKKFLHACEEMFFGRVRLIFHSAEIAVLLLVIAAYTKNLYVLAIAAGYLLHLILDLAGNPLGLFSYFLIRRFIRKFRVSELLKSGKAWKKPA